MKFKALSNGKIKISGVANGASYSVILDAHKAKQEFPVPKHVFYLAIKNQKHEG